MRDAQLAKKVEAKLDGKSEAVAFTAEVNMKRVGGPDAALSIEELERHADIARARISYASLRANYWNREVSIRNSDLNEALIALYQKKHSISDEQLEGTWEQDFTGVFSKRDKNGAV